MGHSTAAMIQKTCSHMDQAHDYLSERLKRAEGGSASG